MKIVFTVSNDETGGFVARWDDPSGGGITTQGENLAELQEMVGMRWMVTSRIANPLTQCGCISWKIP